MDDRSIISNGRIVFKQIHDTMWYLLGRFNNGSFHADLRSIHGIHFLCSGNICRSAFAEHYARSVFRKKGIAIDVSSSGLMAKKDEVPPENANIAARMFGIDLSIHKPRLTDEEMLGKCSLIAGMHYFHYLESVKRYNLLRERCFLLKHLAWPSYIFMNINDPYGKDLGEFLRTFSEIKNCIDIISHRVGMRK